MIHKIFPVGLLRCNCSVMGDEQSREAIVIDPGDDVSLIEQYLAERNLHVKAIVITHAHIDHVGGAAKLRGTTGAPVFMNEADRMLLDNLATQAQWLGMSAAPEPTDVDSAAGDGTRLRLGPHEIEVLETPGHTPGSICLWIADERTLIAGDTLFQGSIGRTDLPGGDGRKILSSIHTKLLVLPDETLVVPGHGAETTIGNEREHNPFLGLY